MNCDLWGFPSQKKLQNQLKFFIFSTDMGVEMNMLLLHADALPSIVTFRKLFLSLVKWYKMALGATTVLSFIVNFKKLFLSLVKWYKMAWGATAVLSSIVNLKKAIFKLS